MLYRRQTNNFNKIFSVKKIGITFLIVILIILSENISPGIITKPIQSIALSFSFIKNDIEKSVDSLFTLFRSKEILVEENRKLKEQYSSLNVSCSLSIDSLKIKQNELEKSLGRRNTSTKKTIVTGYVVAKPPISSYGTIIIDIGSSSGIKTGNLAVIGEYLIGVISNTEEYRSTIKLFGEKNDSFSVLIGEKRILLSGEGSGLGTFKTRIANETKILIGTTVRLANYPDYIFGEISHANQASNDQYQDLIVKSPVNVFELSSIDIILN